MQGRAERLFLGRFPDLTVEQARKLALQNKGKIAQGINPIHEKRKIQNECTFGQLFHDYMERYSKVYIRGAEIGNLDKKGNLFNPENF